MEKIFFKLKKSDIHNHATESLWAEKVAENTFAVKNVPFYVYGIAFDDQVTCSLLDGILFFNSVHKRSGHSTYRFIVYANVREEDFLKYWNPIQALGCTYEKGEGSLYSVDIPPEVNVHLVYDLLNKGEQDDVWGFEEAFCAINQ